MFCFYFKQKTAYELRIRDWSSDVCSSDLMLHLLGIPHEVVEVDAIRGETRKPPFLAKNPNGRIPLLELEDGTFLPESNAILFYLAEGSRYLPDERLARARAIGRESCRERVCQYV